MPAAIGYRMDRVFVEHPHYRRRCMTGALNQFGNQDAYILLRAHLAFMGQNLLPDPRYIIVCGLLCHEHHQSHERNTYRPLIAQPNWPAIFNLSLRRVVNRLTREVGSMRQTSPPALGAALAGVVGNNTV